MKNNKIIIFLPLIIGFVSSLFVNNDLNNLVLPPYMPPAYVFGIVWSILYLIMGYSLYLVLDCNKCVLNFMIQFIFNITWSFIFFNFNNYLLSVLWIIILIILVTNMLLTFILKNKKAAYLNLPYILWLCIALYLSSSIFVLN